MWKEVNLDGEDVLGLECNGKLSKRDFETMHTWLDRELKGAEAKPALVIFMASFEGYESAAAMWADMKVDTRHADDFSRISQLADSRFCDWRAFEAPAGGGSIKPLNASIGGVPRENGQLRDTSCPVRPGCPLGA